MANSHRTSSSSDDDTGVPAGADATAGADAAAGAATANARRTGAARATGAAGAAGAAATQATGATWATRANWATGATGATGDTEATDDAGAAGAAATEADAAGANPVPDAGDLLFLLFTSAVWEVALETPLTLAMVPLGFADSSLVELDLSLPLGSTSEGGWAAAAAGFW